MSWKPQNPARTLRWYRNLYLGMLAGLAVLTLAGLWLAVAARTPTGWLVVALGALSIVNAVNLLRGVRAYARRHPDRS